MIPYSIVVLALGTADLARSPFSHASLASDLMYFLTHGVEVLLTRSDIAAAGVLVNIVTIEVLDIPTLNHPHCWKHSKGLSKAMLCTDQSEDILSASSASLSCLGFWAPRH